MVVLKANLAVIVATTCGASIVASPFVIAKLANSQSTSEKIEGRVPVAVYTYDKQISGIVRQYNEGEILATPDQGVQGQSVSPQAVASPITSVPTFNQTVVRNPVNLELFDQNAPADGDIVNVILNNQTVRSNLVLTNTPQTVPLNLVSGVNTIQIVAVNIGSTAPNTACFQVAAAQTVENAIRGNCLGLSAGQQFVTTFGFPQIAFCLTNPIRFPCTTQAYPESAKHILEAKGIPPQPITAPLKAGQTGNPVPPNGYPRLLTIDRPGSTTRRTASTSAYVCPTGQQRDEFPQALFLENAGAAHIKCISSGDNQGSGRSLGLQINAYVITPGGAPQQPLDNGDVVEIQVLR